ncbi:MAG TPA: chromosome segregation protein SMC, partial [Lachnospiraceae bacterium]|nr:chromosome segregation protein SMC [Lachnospiraceae bacterium]
MTCADCARYFSAVSNRLWKWSNGMYLKSLEVHGFKSFANKMLFEFHNGITAIVGPNGSGKSNVADAVRWVLGEQSARQLRGAKMEDVIFAGTQMRKPLGYAYVAITISNEDHKLNVPYEEVKIARRVYRSGESEYLLNGASCRLKDVQELLFDTGIGKEGYSIIGQGQIDKILSGKPEERRELFDEAAGIVKYKKRKAAAERNLAEEEQNLVRIEDILSELEKQVEPLQKQSEKAKEYLSYRDTLRNLDINLFLSEYDRIHDEIVTTEQKQEIALRDLEDAGREFEQAKEEYVALEVKLDALGKELEQKKEVRSAEQVSLNQSEGEIKLLREQINTVTQNKAHSMEQMASLQERKESAGKEEELYALQKKEAESSLQELSKGQAEAEKTIQNKAAEIASLEKEAEQCNQDLLSYLNENTSVKTEQERIRTLLEQNNLDKAELTKRILENKAEASGLNDTLQTEKGKLEDINQKIDSIDASLTETRRFLDDAQKERESLRQEHRDVQQQYLMENSRLQSLRNLTERYEGYGQSIKRVMEQKKNYPGIVGVVADILSVQKEYELAVETALGGSIQNIVTEDEQTAKEMIAYLKKNRYGRATFLPLTNIKAKPVNLSGNILSEPGVIGVASTLVKAEPAFFALVEYLLGRFVVTDTIDHASALARKYHYTIRIVTLEGELLNPGGSMSGGAFKNNQNLLGRRREMEVLAKQTEELNNRLSELTEDISKKKVERQELLQKMEAGQKVRQELSLQQNTTTLNYDRAMQDLQKNKENYDFICLEQSGLLKRREELLQEMQRIDEKVRSNESLEKERESHLAELNRALEEKREEQETLLQKNSEFLQEISAQNQSLQFIEENRSRIQETLCSLEEELTLARQSGKDADAQVQQKQEEIQKTQEKIVSIQQQIQKLSGEIDEETARREELSVQHKGFFEKREELSAKKSDLDKECFRLSSQKEKLAEKIDSYTDYMWEQYELTYHTAKENKTEVSYSVAQMRSEIAKLKSQMKSLGDVNINAIEQYQEVQERYGLLSTQHSDLIEAANVLKGIIEELDTEMR